MSLGRTLSISFILLFALMSFSCGSGERQGDISISISAAASLTDAIEEITNQYHRETGVDFELNFASSSTCARQISQGMDIDIFISANGEWVDYLSELYVKDSKRVILENRLVIVAPSRSHIALSQLNDLRKPAVSRIAMGDPTHVPAGRYGREALEKNELWTDIESKVVGAMDVRAALGLAASQAVDCAIVYNSDALIDDSVKIVYEFTPEQSPLIEYFSCRLGESEAAEHFYSFLFGEEASALFEQYGFEAANPEEAALK